MRTAHTKPPFENLLTPRGQKEGEGASMQPLLWKKTSLICLVACFLQPLCLELDIVMVLHISPCGMGCLGKHRRDRQATSAV